MKNSVREPIATWWMIEDLQVKIEPVKFVALTERTVTYIDTFYSGRVSRANRASHRTVIFPTFEEAKTEAVRRAKEEVAKNKEALQMSRSALGQWKSLKAPAVRRKGGR